MEHHTGLVNIPREEDCKAACFKFHSCFHAAAGKKFHIFFRVIGCHSLAILCLSALHHLTAGNNVLDINVVPMSLEFFAVRLGGIFLHTGVYIFTIQLILAGREIFFLYPLDKRKAQLKPFMASIALCSRICRRSFYFLLFLDNL